MWERNVLGGGNRLKNKIVTGKDDGVSTVTGAQDGGQPFLSCPLTHFLNQVVLDTVNFLINLLCELLLT